MNLEEKLASIREGAVKRIPAEKRETMGKATRALRESGIMDRVIGIGDRLPEFALASREGRIVRSTDLLAEGPLVVTVFRGSW